jgi:Spy/CpxP family protein refolding chaperone
MLLNHWGTLAMHGPRSLTIALLALAVSNPIAAAEEAKEPLTAATEQYSLERKRLIADNLHLTASEAEHFWPLYEQYEKELFVLTEKRRATIAKFGENYESMTDAMAKEILLDRVNLEEERIRLRRVYLPKFEKVLPVKKLARYYQIESKIRAAVECGIAQELPLIK